MTEHEPYLIVVRNRNYDDFQGRYTGGPKRKGPRQLMLRAPHQESHKWGFGQQDQFKVESLVSRESDIIARVRRLTPDEWLPPKRCKRGVARVQRPKNGPSVLLPFPNGAGGLQIEGLEGRWQAHIFAPIHNVPCTPIDFGLLELQIPQSCFAPYRREQEQEHELEQELEQEKEDAAHWDSLDDDEDDEAAQEEVRHEIIVAVAAILERYNHPEQSRSKVCAEIARAILG